MKFWCALKCVFEFLNGLDQTLCLQPMAGHSVLQDFSLQKPNLKRQNKLNYLRAGFEIAQGYWIGHS